MKVYVVISEYWNGSSYITEIVAVYKKESEAIKEVDSQKTEDNKKYMNACWYDEYELLDKFKN